MNEAWKPRIVVMGAGAMGGLFGAILSQGGLTVTLVDIRTDQVEAIRRAGLQIVGFGGERSVRVPATTDAGDIDGADLVLFQCKAQGTRAAAAAVKHLVEGGAIVVSFQNGLGNEEVIGSVLGMENVLGGLTTMAANTEAPGTVRDFSRVPSYVGEMGGGLSSRAERVAAALTAGGLETYASDDIVRDIWKKLLGNIALSAASGATNLTGAGVLRIPELETTALRALDEAAAVAEAVGIELDGSQARDALSVISRPGGTGDNKSSLCMDLLHARPTEVDYLYGSVIKLGRESGVPTPTLDTLLSIVKGLESHYMGRGSTS